ncbi:MAG: acyl-ACP--UDP-N-acetylglucosamine O-acyltransferase [Rickettsiales bacterium]|jgi:UDP-N-acetylglucosamine acyltransferase|nr:acyl-ACP--UDP-N-acetylglucosamine O-acyltransferase [Rickettsiales bacterium]
MQPRSKQLVPLEILHARKGVEIAATARVSPNAKIGEGTTIGDWCIIDDGVEIGKYNTIKNNVVIEGRAKIGDGCIIWPFTVIGNHSHDLKFSADERTATVLGEDVVVREFTNIHAGTIPGGEGTAIGDRTYLMSHTHIGHDSYLENDCLLSQGTTLGGEVRICDHAIIGGCTAIHQLCTIGRHSIIGGCSKITMDVIPYGMSDGNPQNLTGLNIVGLRRNGFPDEDIRTIKEVYKSLFLSTDRLWAQRVETAREVYGGIKVADDILGFISSESRRIIAKPFNRHKREDQ